MSEGAFSIHELERDLGQPAVLRVLLNVGGQHRHIPLPANAKRSKLNDELGPETTLWLAARFGGERVEFPSRRGTEDEEAARKLLQAVLEAGLTQPSQSANDLAKRFGVTSRRIKQIRQELRAGCSPDPLPLFPD